MERDPQEGENVPEIIRTEDEAKSGDINEIIEGTNKTIGRQEKKFGLKFIECSWFRTHFQ